MKALFPPFAGLVGLCVVSFPAGAEPVDGDAPEPVRIVVRPTAVSLDGDDRPLLGKSLSDGLIAGLIDRERYQVVEEGDDLLGLPVMDDGGMDADLVLIPRVVGVYNYYRFTMKKVDAKTSSVEDIIELTFEGDREEMFQFIETALLEFDHGERPPPPVQIEEAPEERRPEDRPQPEPEADLPFPPVVAQAPAPRVPEPVPVARPLEKRRIGVVRAVSNPWKFAVIEPDPGATFYPTEQIMVLYGDYPFAKLRVSKETEGRVIADYGQLNRWTRPVLPGDEVFGWRVPE